MFAKNTISIFLLLLLSVFTSCKKDDDPDSLPQNIDFRHEMRDFVINISRYAKNINSAFVVIPQNGVELVSSTGDESGLPETSYLKAIDGIGQEDLFYGYDKDNRATPAGETQWLTTFLDMAKNNGGARILVTDYCSTISKIDYSYSENNAKGYISFAAGHRELDNIPDYPLQVYGENSKNISNIKDAKNFLYLINPDNEFATKQKFVDAVSKTNYDILIMDLFFNGEEYSATQIKQLKQKAGGGTRLLVCYMSIGEAEDYRYYWNPGWRPGNPAFLYKENPAWPGNYVVKYWNKEWQEIIYGNDNSYLKKILDSGFNGVYLDIIDAFEQFEE